MIFQTASASRSKVVSEILELPRPSESWVCSAHAGRVLGSIDI